MISPDMAGVWKSRQAYLHPLLPNLVWAGVGASRPIIQEMVVRDGLEVVIEVSEVAIEASEVAVTAVAMEEEVVDSVTGIHSAEVAEATVMAEVEDLKVAVMVEVEDSEVAVAEDLETTGPEVGGSQLQPNSYSK